MITDLRPVMVEVAQKEAHSSTFATLFVDFSIDFKPGQFIMVWIPGVDEKPYTISHHSPDRFGITVEAKGIFSKKAVSLNPGDKIGIRGPFGNGFNISTKQKIAVVAGGCGMAPLAPLIEALEAYGNKELLLIHGARSKEFLLYPDRFSTHRKVCTDDGSKGHKGFVTDVLEQEILARQIIAESKENSTPAHLDMVYACGPEIMMAKVFEICETHNIPCQVSLERYMRCGFGVCGACVCDSQVVCKDGPVFSSQSLRSMEDFNTRALLKTGQPVPLEEYASWRCQ
ncbi:MAG: dihydroorotate dehydrogenase electron transfer subunit [Desulfobacterales bacterium]|nr:dihydroorotate dehydrogenase electron transfer subunit [Desulfobacterales bacterium]